MSAAPEKPRTYSERMLAVARRTLERKRQEAANKPASQPHGNPSQSHNPAAGLTEFLRDPGHFSR